MRLRSSNRLCLSTIVNFSPQRHKVWLVRVLTTESPVAPAFQYVRSAASAMQTTLRTGWFKKPRSRTPTLLAFLPRFLKSVLVYCLQSGNQLFTHRNQNPLRCA